MYPAIVNHPNPKKNRPEGKLRLMYEAAVVAFICQEAGGAAVNEKGAPILEIIPEHHHQRSALYVGSKRLVEDWRASCNNRAEEIAPGRSRFSEAMPLHVL